MQKGKQKCDKCKGKGGRWHVSRRAGGIFLGCVQCAGKGCWWAGKRPHKAKVS